MPPPENRYLIWGGYGWGNTGDDLTLAVALQDLRKIHGGNLSLLTPDRRHTDFAHPGLDLIDAPWKSSHGEIGRWIFRLADLASSGGRGDALAGQLYRLALRGQRHRPVERNWHHAFTSASGLHLVGGGYLTDVFALRYLLRPIRVARALNLPITTSPLGLGPFAHPRAARAVTRALRGVPLLVRDEASLRFCRSHGLSAELRRDDGFRLREVIEAGGDSDRAVSGPPSIGVCIFRQHGGRWSARVEDWWVTVLRSMARAFPRLPIRGFCFHTDRKLDFATTRRLFERAGLSPDAVQPPEPDYRAAVAGLRKFSAIVATRFHAVVAAGVFDIPCVAVTLDGYYETKMRSVADQARRPIPVVHPAQISPDAVIQDLRQALDSHPAYSQATAQ